MFFNYAIGAIFVFYVVVSIVLLCIMLPVANVDKQTKQGPSFTKTSKSKK